MLELNRHTQDTEHGDSSRLVGNPYLPIGITGANEDLAPSSIGIEHSMQTGRPDHAVTWPISSNAKAPHLSVSGKSSPPSNRNHALPHEHNASISFTSAPILKTEAMRIARHTGKSSVLNQEKGGCREAKCNFRVSNGATLENWHARAVRRTICRPVRCDEPP